MYLSCAHESVVHVHMYLRCVHETVVHAYMYLRCVHENVMHVHTAIGTITLMGMFITAHPLHAILGE